MGCGASSAIPAPNPTAGVEPAGATRQSGKPRTRRASIEAVEPEDDRERLPEGKGRTTKKSGRARRTSVEEVKALQHESSEDEIAQPSRLQPKSVAQQRQDRRRGSVEQEHAALAAAAAAAAEQESRKKKKKKKKTKGPSDEYLLPVPHSRFAADFERTKLSDLTKLAILGVGTFSRVSLVKHKRTGKTYALKKMNKQTVDKLKQKKHIMNEKSILQEMDHPFVIQLHATFKDPVSLYMVTEPVLGGELFSVLTREEYLEERQAQFYVGCIVLALEALHAKNNVYRDLKPENILLDSQGYVKVCDFGFAKKLMQTDTTTTTCGTPEYVSPEMLNSSNGHGKPTDWWCVGILIYECIFATTPFAARDYAETYEQIQRYAGGRMKIPYDVDGVSISKDCKLLIGGLLSPDPTRRMSAVAIKQHGWFKTMNWDALLKKQITAPWVPTVRSEEDASNFEGEEYGDEPTNEKPYNGDPEWFRDF